MRLWGCNSRSCCTGAVTLLLLLPLRNPCHALLVKPLFALAVVNTTVVITTAVVMHIPIVGHSDDGPTGAKQQCKVVFQLGENGLAAVV